MQEEHLTDMKAVTFCEQSSDKSKQIIR